MKDSNRLVRFLGTALIATGLTLALGACGDDNGNGGGQDAGQDMGQDMGGGGTATVQVIHNSADPAASTVDVFANGEIWIDDFEFRTATTFQELDAGDYTIAIAGSDAATAGGDDTTLDDGEEIASWDVTLEADTSYTVVADGVVDPSNFDTSQNSEIGLDLKVTDGALESASSSEGFAINLHHGTTDAGEADVSFNNGQGPMATVPYGEFSGYINFDNAQQIQTANVALGGPAPLQAIQTGTQGSQLLTGGSAATVLASGFVDPSANEDGPEFAFVACPTESSGGTDRIVCPELPEAARAQIIHASPSEAASEVNVCFQGNILTDDPIAYKSALPYITLPSTFEFDVALVASDASDCSSPIIETTVGPFDGGTSQALVASGTVGDNLGVRVGETVDFTGDTGTVGITIFHGSPDAPNVDVVATNPDDDSDLPLAENVAFGEFALAGDDGIVDGADYTPLRLWQADNDMELFSYDVSALTNFASLGVVAVAHGFVQPPSGVTDRDFEVTVFTPDGQSSTLSETGN